MGQPFDPGSGTLSGEPQAIASGVVDDISTWHMDASASNSNLLVLGSGGTADWQLIWTDRTGKQIGTVADKLTNLQSARLSPQGDRIAMQIDTGVNDIWVLDLARNVRTRLTFGPVSNTYPVWSPDGRSGSPTHRIATATPTCTGSAPTGAAREELPLLTDDLVTVASCCVLTDGKTLFYSRGPAGSNWRGLGIIA